MSISKEQIQANIQASKERKQALRAQQQEVQNLFLQPFRNEADKLGYIASRAQFHHDRDNERTFAVAAPSVDELKTAAIKLLGGGKEVGVIVNVGMSSVNRSTDNYDRRVGRLVATSKMQPVLMKLESAEVEDTGATQFVLTLDKLVVVFISEDNNKESPMLVYASRDR